MNKLSPELWLIAFITFGIFYGGIRGLKKSMKVKEVTRFDLNDRGGAISALIIATYISVIFFIPKQYCLPATLLYVALFIVNATYWIIQKIILARKESRKNLQAQAEIYGAQQGGPGYRRQSAPQPDP